MTIWRTSAIAALVFAIQFGSSGAVHAEEKTAASELQSYIGKAQKNPLAEIAHARTKAAQAQEREAAGHRWASFEVTSFLAPSPKIRCDNADCTRTSPQNVTINIAGIFGGIDLKITQPLYTGGKLHYLQSAAKSATKASEELAKDVAGEIASNTAKAYYSYQLSQELLWMLEDGAEQIESGLATLEEKLAEGSDDATIQDRYRIQALQAEVGAQIADAKLGQQFALDSLRALIGNDKLKPEIEYLEASEFTLPSGAQPAPFDPRVEAAMYGVEAQRALEKFESRSFLPNLAIVGGARFARAQGVDNPPGAFANDPFNNSSAYVALVAQWQLTPLAQSARVDRQRAKKHEAMATLAAAKRLATLADKSAMAQATQAKVRLAALKNGERAGKAWVASVLQADAIGAASAKDLADAYLAYFSAHSKLLQSIFQWNIAAFELRRRRGEFARVL
ncbi:MAG: TolC family protein [Kofleriaceae bacterium]|nr:TolC family protein [Kofleriaceae bacterium]